MQVWVVVGGVWGLRTPDRPEKISRGYNVKHFNLSRHGSEGCGVILLFRGNICQIPWHLGNAKMPISGNYQRFQKNDKSPGFHPHI